MRKVESWRKECGRGPGKHKNTEINITKEPIFIKTTIPSSLTNLLLQITEMRSEDGKMRHFKFRV